MILLNDDQATLAMMALRALQKLKAEGSPVISQLEAQYEIKCPTNEELEKLIQGINLCDFDIEKFPVIVGCRDDKTVHSSLIFENTNQAEYEFTRLSGIKNPDGESRHQTNGVTYSLSSIGVPAVYPAVE